jgi:hypothetical protein
VVDGLFIERHRRHAGLLCDLGTSEYEEQDHYRRDRRRWPPFSAYEKHCSNDGGRSKDGKKCSHEGTSKFLPARLIS